MWVRASASNSSPVAMGGLPARWSSRRRPGDGAPAPPRYHRRVTQPRDNPRRAVRLAAAAALAATWLALAHPAAGAPVRVVAAGDIACDPGHPSFNGGAGTAIECSQRATSDLALSLQPQAALLLGDLQYDDGTFAKFQASFDPSWGRLEPRLRP